VLARLDEWVALVPGTGIGHGLCLAPQRGTRGRLLQTGALNRLGQRHAELDRAQLVAPHLVELGALGEHPVQLVRQERHRLVALVRLDGDIDRGPVYREVPLGLETRGKFLPQVALEFHSQAQDVLLMPEQSLGFLVNKRFQGRCEFEVYARDDQLRIVLPVHRRAFDFVLTLFGRKWSRLRKVKSKNFMPTPDTALKNIAAVIITGGSSGIGKSFIELIGKLRPDLEICNLSRREPTISGNTQLKLRHVACDLSDSAQVGRALGDVAEFLKTRAPSGGILLINNSGFGVYGRFPEPAIAQQVEMVDVNVRAVLQLTGGLLPAIKARGGVIVTVASTAAFQPTAYLGVYGATKAFVLHWSLALNEELRGTGVRTLAVCPGPTSTDFFRRAGLAEGSVPDAFGETSEQVVLASLRAIAAGKSMIVSGWRNKLMTAVSSKFPKPLVARLGAIVLSRYRMKQVKA